MLHGLHKLALMTECPETRQSSHTLFGPISGLNSIETVSHFWKSNNSSYKEWTAGVQFLAGRGLLSLSPFSGRPWISPD
jgi:hypothetical protein